MGDMPPLGERRVTVGGETKVEQSFLTADIQTCQTQLLLMTLLIAALHCSNCWIGAKLVNAIASTGVFSQNAVKRVYVSDSFGNDNET